MHCLGVNVVQHLSLTRIYCASTEVRGDLHQHAKFLGLGLRQQEVLF